VHLYFSNNFLFIQFYNPTINFPQMSMTYFNSVIKKSLKNIVLKQLSNKSLVLRKFTGFLFGK